MAVAGWEEVNLLGMGTDLRHVSRLQLIGFIVGHLWHVGKSHQGKLVVERLVSLSEWECLLYTGRPRGGQVQG